MYNENIITCTVYHSFRVEKRRKREYIMKKQILTVTLNPCIDRTILVDNFKQGKTNYYKVLREEVAGKGINVAIAINNLQIPVKSIGIGFDRDYEKMLAMFKQQKLSYELVKVNGSLRNNIKIFDSIHKEMTECNEQGMGIDEKKLQDFMNLLSKNIKISSMLVANGSVPSTVERDIYKRMIHMANEAQILSILDASGELLIEGMKEKPLLIKPNKEEFMQTFEVEEKDIEKKAKEIVKEGIRYVCVSLGSEGAILVNRNGVQRMHAINVDVKGLQGAGDAMVAGICKAVWEEREDKILPYALASAASTVMREGTLMGTIEDFCNLLSQISNS